MRMGFARALGFAVLCVAGSGTVWAQTATSARHEHAHENEAGSTEQDPAYGPDAVRQELERLRAEFETLRQQYEQRLNVLETKLAALDQQAAPQQPVTIDGASLPVYGNATALSKIFNPDVAVIGNFVGVATPRADDPRPPFDLREAETSLQAIVDPFAKADFFLGFSREGVEIEEGYVTFPTVPGGLLVKAGKFRSAIGRVNTAHTHNLPWIDRPLLIGNLVGGDEGIADSGVSAARLIPNPWLFLEITGELTSVGSSDVSSLARARAYRDVTESTNVDLGLSFLSGAASIVAADATTATLLSVDGTFRYRPLRRAIYRSFLARSELVWRREDAEAATAFGVYAGAEYQFARRWFAGVRWDYSQRAMDPDARDIGASWLVTFWPSEFSQIRGQYRRTTSAERRTVNDLFIQVLFSIGAHGAHAY
jgi:hypothetical protein